MFVVFVIVIVLSFTVLNRVPTLTSRGASCKETIQSDSTELKSTSIGWTLVRASSPAC
jgi:hypothetical protein